MCIKKESINEWAYFRFSIIGSLLASPPTTRGELKTRLQELATAAWIHPKTGKVIQFSYSSLERWYYQAKKSEPSPIQGLIKAVRKDAGTFRVVDDALITQLKTQYNDHKSWSVQLHYDNLQSQFKTLPSYATVRRLMKAHGLLKHRRQSGPNSPSQLKAQKRRQNFEIRSFEVAHVNSLWHLDFHHGSLQVITPKGEWVTPKLLGIIDDHSRLICHLQWYYGETAENLVHGLCQAFQKRALPRCIYSDNGSAMESGEFTSGLHQLSILHEKTLPYSPYQNAKQEVFWVNIEGRLLPMLEGIKELTLSLLNEVTQVWVEAEYHQKIHTELKETPINRYLHGHNVGRESPDSNALRNAFRIQAVRKQRRSDGTITLMGKRFEIPNAYRHLNTITLRYASWNLASSVSLVDPNQAKTVIPLYPINKVANANGQRKPTLPAQQEDEFTPPPSDMAPLLKKMLQEYAATGLPPSYLTHQEPDYD